MEDFCFIIPFILSFPVEESLVARHNGNHINSFILTSLRERTVLRAQATVVNGGSSNGSTLR